MAALRLFIALDLPQSLCQSLAGLGRQMGQMGLGLRWVKQDAMHLTLRFLGDVEHERLPAIKGAMEKAAGATEAFWLEARGLGAFPGSSNARVVWAGVHGGVQALCSLAASLEDALEEAGFERENRPFKAHLTIGRAKSRPDPRILAQAIAELGHYCLEPFPVDKVLLFQSELKPLGPVYTALHRAKLKTANALLEAQR